MRFTPAVDSWGRCVGGMIVFCYSHSPTAASLRHRNLKERGGRASLSLSLFPLAHFAPVSISNSLYKKSHQQASDKYLWFQKCFHVLFFFSGSSPSSKCCCFFSVSACAHIKHLKHIAFHHFIMLSRGCVIQISLEFHRESR